MAAFLNVRRGMIGGILPRRLMGQVSSFLAVLLVAIPAHAADGYYSTSDRPGWWWKNDPKEEEPAPEPKQPKQSPPKEETKPDKQKSRRHVKISDYSEQLLWSMHPDEFVPLMDEFKKQAVQSNSEEDVKAFVKMLDVSRRRADAFKNVTQLVLQKNPSLSLEHDYPTSAPGKEAVREIARLDMAGRVTAARKNFGLVYLFKSDCPYCVAQEKILSYFIDSRHWEVKPINVSSNPDLALRFNVSITPTLLLVKQGDDAYLPLSYGVIALNELEERIYNGVRLLDGEITPEQYNMKEYQRGGAFDPTAPLR